MITILVSNPQPNGQSLPFDESYSLQTVDESKIEKV